MRLGVRLGGKVAEVLLADRASDGRPGSFTRSTSTAIGARRPITAIRQGDRDGNPRTVADPDWVPRP